MPFRWILRRGLQGGCGRAPARALARGGGRGGAAPPASGGAGPAPSAAAKSASGAAKNAIAVHGAYSTAAARRSGGGAQPREPPAHQAQSLRLLPQARAPRREGPKVRRHPGPGNVGRRGGGPNLERRRGRRSRGDGAPVARLRRRRCRRQRLRFHCMHPMGRLPVHARRPKCRSRRCCLPHRACQATASLWRPAAAALLRASRMAGARLE